MLMPIACAMPRRKLSECQDHSLGRLGERGRVYLEGAHGERWGGKSRSGAGAAERKTAWLEETEDHSACSVPEALVTTRLRSFGGVAQ
jgi:hypothetical protein